MPSVLPGYIVWHFSVPPDSFPISLTNDHTQFISLSFLCMKFKISLIFNVLKSLTLDFMSLYIHTFGGYLLWRITRLGFMYKSWFLVSIKATKYLCRGCIENCYILLRFTTVRGESLGLCYFSFSRFIGCVIITIHFCTCRGCSFELKKFRTFCKSIKPPDQVIKGKSHRIWVCY